MRDSSILLAENAIKCVHILTTWRRQPSLTHSESFGYTAVHCCTLVLGNSTEACGVCKLWICASDSRRLRTSETVRSPITSFWKARYLCIPQCRLITFRLNSSVKSTPILTRVSSALYLLSDFLYLQWIFLTFHSSHRHRWNEMGT